MLTFKEYLKGLGFSNGRIIVGCTNEGWALYDKNCRVIISPGTYNWIDKFWNGFARVTVLPEISEEEIKEQLDIYYQERGKGKPSSYFTKLKECPLDIRKKYAKFGLINEKGEEIIAPTYDSIWNFYEKNYSTFILEKDGQTYKASFLHPTDITPCQLRTHFYEEDTDIESHYNIEEDWNGEESEYAGTYAHDVAGFSDDEIDDIFDGDPDAYWNID